jgi:hypothetical protein
VAIFREKTVTGNASSNLWDQFVCDFVRGDGTSQVFNVFFKEGIDRIGLVREALRKPGGGNRAAAVALLEKMGADEQKQLFAELMQLARSAHGPLAVVRKIIASLPRDWVLERIDAEVERIFDDQQYDDYWMCLELLAELDRDRAVRLAQRATRSSDAEIRELGLETLATLDGGNRG